MINSVGYSFSTKYNGNRTQYMNNQSFKKDIHFGNKSAEIKGFKRACRSLGFNEDKIELIKTLGLEKKLVELFPNNFLGGTKDILKRTFGEKFADITEEMIFGNHPFRNKHYREKLKKVEEFQKLVEEALNKNSSNHQNYSQNYSYSNYGYSNSNGRTFTPQPNKIEAARAVFKKYGVNINSSDNLSSDSLKKVYYKLAKQYHPDRNPKGEKAFQEISGAYEILTTK